MVSNIVKNLEHFSPRSVLETAMTRGYARQKAQSREPTTLTLLAEDFRPVYTLQSTPAVPSSYDEAIERARARKPGLRERAAEAERPRRLHSGSVADILENGLYGL